MILISHRGNINGIVTEKENDPLYIDVALNEYDVEVDLWLENNKLFLGHDFPLYEIHENYIKTRKHRLWLHCKTIKTFLHFYRKYHCFYHEQDKIILTSKRYIISHVDHGIVSDTIKMMPEKYNYSINELKICKGICSDFIQKYKQ